MYFNDIYSKLNNKLVIYGYTESGNKTKRKLVHNALKNYLVQKLDEIYYVDLNTIYDKSIEELVDMFANIIPMSEHFDTLRHLVHFILNLSSDIQEYYIVWQVEDDKKFMAEPVFIMNESGKVETFITHKYTDYANAFNKVYNIFNNYICENDFSKKLK